MLEEVKVGCGWKLKGGIWFGLVEVIYIIAYNMDIDIDIDPFESFFQNRPYFHPSCEPSRFEPFLRTNSPHRNLDSTWGTRKLTHGPTVYSGWWLNQPI